MTFYIAGKITGDPDYKSKFDAMKDKILEAWPWCQVLNPSDNPPGMRNADYMRLSFAMIDCADVVIFLPDWEESKGARIEKAYCEYIHKRCVDWDELTYLFRFGDFPININRGAALDSLREIRKGDLNCVEPNVNRESILDAAKRCVCGDREQDYGSPENNFRTIASMWNSYLYGAGLMENHDPTVWKGIKPHDVAAMLALLKIAPKN